MADRRLVVPKYVSMKEMNFQGLVTLVRLDINSPIEPGTGRIIDSSRIKSHLPTIKRLVSQGAKIVLLAHQGQRGSADFVSLRTHARILSELGGVEVKFVPEVYGALAERAIEELRDGDVLLLENTRFVEEETREVPFEEHAKSPLVQKLSSKASCYINDAFAASHRNHASLVGFPFVLPSFAGLLMEEELVALKRIVDGDLRPTVFLIGGGKVADSIKIIKKIIESDVADKLVLSGLVGNIFLLAKGIRLGKKMDSYVSEKGLSTAVEDARKILSQHGPKIVLPVDVAVERDGVRVEVDVYRGVNDEDNVMDIGSRSIELIRDEIKGSKTAFMRGPAGVVEKDGFEKGTAWMLELLAELKIYTVIGGGHTRIMAEKLGLVDKLGYASTGGGALLTFLSGEPLPALVALNHSVERTKSFVNSFHPHSEET